MTVVQTSVEMDATPEDVWKVVANPRNLPRWNQHVAAVRGVPPEGLSEGLDYETDLRFMGVRGMARAHVVELRPPRYARIRLSGLLSAVVETWIEPLDGGRSRLAQRVQYRFIGGPLGRLAERAVRRLGAQSILRRGVLAQKQQVEEEVRRAG
jgi:carbon monoxide dehydrogenase subunit G